MKKAVIEIEMENDAFKNAPTHELSRILSRLSDDVARHFIGSEGDSVVAVDINGNTVGQLDILQRHRVIEPKAKRVYGLENHNYDS